MYSLRKKTFLISGSNRIGRPHGRPFLSPPFPATL
nr:MAG TPA: hypothetical protein [Caudoviricetes sp.]